MLKKDYIALLNGMSYRKGLFQTDVLSGNFDETVIIFTLKNHKYPLCDFAVNTNDPSTISEEDFKKLLENIKKRVDEEIDKLEKEKENKSKATELLQQVFSE